jgi:hypothetical protein
MVQEEIYDIGLKIKILGPYIKAKTPVNCLCEVCGHTWIGTANSLLSGQGCNNCAGRINPTIEELQKQLDELGKRFTVSGPFVKSTDKLLVTCVDCGFEWKAISNSLRRESYGCSECRKSLRPVKVKPEPKVRPKKDKIEKPKLPTRAERSYEGFYSKLEERGIRFTLISDFVDYKTKIHVFCNECETMSLKGPSSILLDACAICSRKAKGSLEKVQAKLNENNRNITVSGTYTNAFGKLDCHCKVCGCDWSTNPHNLDRTGCPSCALTGYDPNKPGYLYYLRVSDNSDVYWKIGITNIGLKGRFRPADRELIEVLYCHLFDDGFVAQKAERNILDMFSEYRAENVNLLRAGNTELFTKDVLQMDHLSSWSI